MKALISSFMVLILVSSCSKKALLGLEQAKIKADLATMQIRAEYCTLDPNAISDDTYLALYIDASGSNFLGNGTTDTSSPTYPYDGFATDPDGYHRLQRLLDQLQDQEENENLFYTAYTFNCPTCQERGDGRDPDIMPGFDDTSEEYPFTNSLDTFKNVIQNQLPRNGRDIGGTPIHHTLKAMYQLVYGEAIKAKQHFEETQEIKTKTFKLVLLTDGVLTDLVPNDFPGWKPYFDTEMKKLMDLRQDLDLGIFIDRISVSTALYHHEEKFFQKAYDSMEYIAKLGEGEFYVFNTSTGSIDWSKLMHVFSRSVETEEIQTIINNRAIHWNRKEQTQCPDTDGDFLCDFEEILKGSDPFNIDSDNNGLTDGAEVRAFNTRMPCNGLFYGRGCNEADAIGATGCFETPNTPEYASRLYNFDGKELTKTKLLDSDDDGFGDCDELLFGSDPEVQDSNGDDLIDSIAAKYDLKIVTPSNQNDNEVSASSLDSDDDGISNLHEVQNGTHPLIANHQLLGVKELQYTKRDSYNPDKGQNCFELDVSQIAVNGNGNDVIEILRQETEKTNTGYTFYQRAVKKVGSDGTVTFTEDDFELKGKQSLLRKKKKKDDPSPTGNN